MTLQKCNGIFQSSNCPISNTAVRGGVGGRGDLLLQKDSDLELNKAAETEGRLFSVSEISHLGSGWYGGVNNCK